MFFEFATNRKMVDSMFPQGIELGKPELCSILVTEKQVQLSLNSNEVPELYPKKWMNSSFNALRVVIELGDVQNLNYNGGQLGWVESLDFLWQQKKLDQKIQMSNGTFELCCTYKYLTIKNIQPYDDVRWK
ncbi:Imm50 family immunity protein [Vibrio rotiferianus]|uniref:Imm50 family immunity protein n=1 Tax=Vibrio rotiferianus TaxID=190895 RepID=UPI00339715AF